LAETLRPATRDAAHGRTERRLGAALAVLWLALGLHGAWTLAAVVDEVPHIAGGLAVVRYGDHRMNPEHPPLLKALAVLPLELVRPPRLDIGQEGRRVASWWAPDQWAWGFDVLFRQNPGPRVTILLCRIVPLLVGLIGGLVAWSWASSLGGARAGLLAFALLLFYPEYLGHARFVTLDVPAAVACGALALLSWRLWESPSAWRAVALLFGCAVLPLVKMPVAVFAGLELLALWLAALARYAASPAPGAARATGFGLPKATALVLAAVLAGWAGQWAAAGFRFRLEAPQIPIEGPVEFVEPAGPARTAAGRFSSWLGEHRLAPQATLATLNQAESGEGRTMFLQGEVRREGWYRYYFVTILLKTPVVHLVLGVLALAAAFRRARHAGRLEVERALLTLGPFLGLFLLHALARFNIGHRHVLFVYLPWAALAGALLAVWFAAGGWRRAAAVAAPALAVATTLVVHPHQATYFNLLGGGSAYAGSRNLMDSNVDWGQDLPEVARWLRERGWTKVNLAYFGMSDPRAYGLADYQAILAEWVTPDAGPPDPTLPTVVSLNCLGPPGVRYCSEAVRSLYYPRFEGEPVHVSNSLLVFAPEREATR
jgi:hypothetical protein